MGSVFGQNKICLGMLGWDGRLEIGFGAIGSYPLIYYEFFLCARFSLGNTVIKLDLVLGQPTLRGGLKVRGREKREKREEEGKI